MKFWSEVPSARAREVLADVATWIWVSLWAVIAYRLYSTLAGFAEVGRAIGQGGSNIQAAGFSVGDALKGLPLVGETVQDLTRSAFGVAGEPFVFVGRELEQLAAHHRGAARPARPRRDPRSVAQPVSALAGPSPVRAADGAPGGSRCSQRRPGRRRRTPPRVASAPSPDVRRAPGAHAGSPGRLHPGSVQAPCPGRARECRPPSLTASAVHSSSRRQWTRCPAC